MIVYTTKLHLKKALTGVAVVCAVLGAIMWLGPERETTAPTAADQSTNLSGTKLKDNDARVALLNRYGWMVEEMPVSELDVQIPQTFDQAYFDYNDVQLRQGLDLTKYQGKNATLYTYRLIEHPSGEEGVMANLLVRGGKLIAADISSPESDGFIHGVSEQYVETSSVEEETSETVEMTSDIPQESTP